MEPVFDTLILSDLHLGSELSRASDAVRMLKRTRFRRLILLGDIFSDLNFHRLKKQHWRFLSYIRKLSNPKRGVEVVWVEGNHDRGLATMMAHLVGVRVYQEYFWRSQGQLCLAIHGHQFDRFISRNAFLSKAATVFHLNVQKLDLKNKLFSRMLDVLSTRWLRLTEKVAQGALHHARLKGAELVFCGHTHHALALQDSDVRYFNTGCWTNGRPTYITILDGEVQIRGYEVPAGVPSAVEAGPLLEEDAFLRA
jgi:UDP-2,3-diacylglucosamine pyrophosphatase LpxH